MSAIDAIGHAWDEPSYVWSADHKQCTAMTMCENDHSHIETQTVDADVEIYEDKQPDCEHEGLAKYTAVFDEPFQTQCEDFPVPAIGHDFQFVEFVWADDYTAKAKYVRSHDGNHVELHDADVSSEVTADPGCETKGVKTYTATYDGHSDTAIEELDSLGGHLYPFDSFVWADDYTAKAKCVCTRDAEHVIEYDATVTSVAKEADCLNAGGNTYAATYDGHTDTKFEKTQEPLGHSYSSDITYVWSDSYSKCSAVQACERDSKYVEVIETVTAASMVEDFDLDEEIWYLEKFAATFTTAGLSQQTINPFVFVKKSGENELEFRLNTPTIKLSEITVLASFNDLPVTRISQKGFANRAYIEIIKLPASITKLCQDAFARSKNIKTLEFAGTKQQWEAIEKHKSWNYDCTFTSVGCADGDAEVTPLVATLDAFEITEVKTGNWVDDVKVEAKSTGISGDIVPPYSIYGSDNRFHTTYTIFESAFEGCGEITSVALPSVVDEIRDNAFASCLKLTDVYYLSTKAD